MSETLSDAAWPLQQAAYQTLRADAGIKALIGDPARIYDAVPAGAAFPFMTVGEARLRDFPGVPGGQEHDLRFQAWSRHGGRREVKQIMGAVYAALHDAVLSLPAHDLVTLRFTFADTWRTADNETWQGVMRYRAVTLPSD